MKSFVVDASVFVSAALRSDGTPGEAISEAASRGVIAMSEAVFHEIAGVLARPKFRTVIAQPRCSEILDLLRTSTAWFVPQQLVTDCRDAKDNKYLELALASKAAAIISGDSDLLVLNPWRGVRILAPAVFLAWISSGSHATSP